MLRLPGKTPLPAAAAGRLEKADCCRLLQVPGAAWELLAEEWRETGELPPAPEPLPDGPPELHLDHPLLHTDR